MITLSSDFGSPYPAAMKGVILQRTDARVVDVAHDFPRQDVRTAAFWLREVLPWFPPAVHLVVVDPGVGTDRAALVVEAGDHTLVGPDNGVLVPAARRLAANAAANADGMAGDADDALRVYRLPVDDPESATFHGRDVFAPAAAAVHDDPPADLDYPERETFVDLAFPDPVLDGETLRGEVLVVDGFGNAITNIPGDALDAHWDGSVALNGDEVPVRDTYAALDPSDRLVTVGSHGNVELAVNQGRGDDAFAVQAGSPVELAPPGEGSARQD